MWQGYTLTDKTVRFVFELMQASGLYSFKTYWRDSGVPRLIQMAKAPNAQAQRPGSPDAEQT